MADHTSSCSSSARKRKQPPAKGKKASEDQDYVPNQENKGVINRVFSEKDEITLLTALIKQANKSDMTTLFDTIKASLDAKNVSKSQVSSKARHLKDKFKSNMEKNVVTFNTHHAANVFNLCQQVWGVEVNTETDHEGGDDDDRNFEDEYQCINACISKLYTKGTLKPYNHKMLTSLIKSWISSQELKDMENEWIGFYLEELQLFNKRVMLTKKQSLLVQRAIHAHKSNT